MTCQLCGRPAPTRKVRLYQNVGMLVMRTHRELHGELCQACISRYFWEFTLVSATLGWWGMVSCVLTALIIPNNIYHRLRSLGLGRLAPGAVAAPLAPAAMPTCPRCQGYQSTAVRPGGVVILSAVLAGLLGALSLLMALLGLLALAGALTADNLALELFFAGFAALALLPLLKLRQHAQRHCQQCGVVWVVG